MTEKPLPPHIQVYISKHLRELTPIFAYASIGDFSHDVPLSDTEDEFTELYVGVQIMIEVIREKIASVEESKKDILRVLNDLEEEKAKVEQAKASDEAILTSVGDGLVATDKQGTVILVNEAAEEILGWKRSEMIGQDWSDGSFKVLNAQGNPVPIPEKPVRQVLDTGKNVRTTKYYYERKDGTRFPVSITAAPVKLHDTVIGVVVVFRDITHEKAIDKAKTEFVSLASHQLRTPLAAIKWNAEMLLQEEVGKVNKKQRTYLENMYHSNQRMIQLVNALLNVSRLELGTFRIEAIPVNVVDICKSVLKELKPHISSKKLRIMQRYNRYVPPIKTDPKLIRIIVQNLLSNAMKYTKPEGKIQIEVKGMKAGETLGQHLVQKDSVVIGVTDTGVGIPKRQQSQIFTKLFRADNVREYDTQGSGLGLYLVKLLIDHMQGMIWFESEENVGTTFYVVLPTDGVVSKPGTRELILAPLT